MLQRIPKCYVIEDAVQIRVSFDKKITIISSDFNNEGILCHYNLDDDSQNINKYINDQRRKNFKELLAQAVKKDSSNDSEPKE